MFRLASSKTKCVTRLHGRYDNNMPQVCHKHNIIPGVRSSQYVGTYLRISPVIFFKISLRREKIILKKFKRLDME